jgi:hypothetical protein
MDVWTCGSGVWCDGWSGHAIAQWFFLNVAEDDGKTPTEDRAMGKLVGIQALTHALSRCDEELVPLTAREVHATATFLRWINFLPRIASRHSFLGNAVCQRPQPTRGSL